VADYRICAHRLFFDNRNHVKSTATGRILLWRGGSLWIGLAGEPAGFHAHHAIQISLPFPPGRVRLQRPAQSWKSYTAAVVAAHAVHAFEARAQHVAQIFVEPESEQGRQLHVRCRSDGIVALPPRTLEKEIAALALAYAGRATDAELIALARAAIAALAGSTHAPKQQLDPRIADSVERIRQSLSGPIPLNEMAAAVHLSPDRFRHLFMKETRVGFRAYVLWLRLACSLAAYVAGSTLTDAAYAGGFADSAHLSRTFRKMFGIAPASVKPE
jgi:AraC family transcriptional regulator